MVWIKERQELVEGGDEEGEWRGALVAVEIACVVCSRRCRKQEHCVMKRNKKQLEVKHCCFQHHSNIEAKHCWRPQRAMKACWQYAGGALLKAYRSGES